MDIAHKEYLEKKDKNELITIILDQEDVIEDKKNDLFVHQLLLKERENTIDTLLKVIKYQNGLNDKGEN